MSNFERALNHTRENGLKSLISASAAVGSRLITQVSAKYAPEVYYPLARMVHRKRDTFDTDSFKAPLDPYKIIWVSPDKVNKVTRREIFVPPNERISQFGEVLGGEWDARSELQTRPYKPEKYGDNEWLVNLLNAPIFENSVFYQAMENHFVYGSPWQDTEFYNRVAQGFGKGKSGIPPSYGTNMDEFEEILYGIDDLYASVEANSMRSEFNVNSKPFLKSLRDSILVDINRHGEFLFVEGRRRLSVAKILDIDKIPVAILVRHRKWMVHRDEMFENDKKLHPDFDEF